MWRAAALAASIGVLAFYFGSDIAALGADYGTGAGEVRSLRLEDGTAVMLDTKSAIRVSYSANARTVELVRGRAFFAVVHDAARPFSVRALGGEARDIGTEFSVSRVADGSAEVLVTQGEVHVSYEGRAVNVLEGFGARWGADTPRLEARHFELPPAIAWRFGRVFVDHQRLGAVVSELSRYRRRPIILMSGEAGSRVVSGIVQVSNIDEGIAALAQTQGLKAISLPFATFLISSN
ncbi:MAG: FecR domain-containing protein [Gammaproteobacteria bacterium]